MLLSQAEKEILAVLCFFDVMNLPLTLLELKKWLKSEISFSRLTELLLGVNLARLVQEQDGFYFLAGRQEILKSRLANYLSSSKKITKARRIIKILKYFPWLEASAIYSSVSLFNADKVSDIDLFFIMAPGRLWSARFWLNLFLKFFRLRPTPRTSQDKICASYLVTSDALDLTKANLVQDDWWHYYGLANFLFVFADDNLKEKFFSVNNWLKEYFFGFQPADFAKSEIIRYRRLKNFFQALAGLVPESFYRALQLLILPSKYKAIMNLDTRVIINSQIIKLHQRDKGRAYNQLFLNRYQEILNEASTA